MCLYMMYSNPRGPCRTYIYITSEEERRLQIFPKNCFKKITPLQRPHRHRHQMLSGGVSQAHAPGLLSILRCRTVIPTCTAPNVSSPLALGLRLRVPTREGALVPRWFLKPFPFPHLSVALLLCRFSSFGWHLPWL